MKQIKPPPHVNDVWLIYLRELWPQNGTFWYQNSCTAPSREQDISSVTTNQCDNHPRSPLQLNHNNNYMTPLKNNNVSKVSDSEPHRGELLLLYSFIVKFPSCFRLLKFVCLMPEGYGRQFCNTSSENSGILHRCQVLNVAQRLTVDRWRWQVED